MANPGDILSEQRLIQAKLVPQRRSSLRRGLLPQNHCGRVARNQVDQPEYHDRDQQQDRDAKDEPADDKPEHCSAPLSERSRYFTTEIWSLRTLHFWVWGGPKARPTPDLGEYRGAE